ncbi:MAG TPA: Holliday junction branch migration protein RuvA [Candidatus Eremiobacteraceae bacterium]|nr:Holliday junction branch migration protein RuvA [Candidatus Eremiobacteraceae bacterium]
MFSRIEGKLRERREQSVVIDVGGLSYDVMVPGCVMDKLVTIELGKPVALEVFSYLSIDGNRGTSAYVGFTNAVEREFFEALLSVSSVGPKTAVRAFARPMAEIARYIDDGDRNALRRLPGIGDQKAKDIIAKLQGKVARFGLIQGESPHAAAQPDHVAEALDVLLQLQYKRGEAERMIKEARAANGSISSAEELLTEVYRRTRGDDVVARSSNAPAPEGETR